MMRNCSVRGDLLGALTHGLFYCYLTALIVLAGTSCGIELMKGMPFAQHSPPDVLSRLRNWDGMWYRAIVERGYDDQPRNASSLAFFPAYPLAARAVCGLFGAPIELALVIVGHLSLLSSFVLLWGYVKNRYTDAAQIRLPEFCLLALGLWPTTVFFRMAYSESLFLLVAIGAMYLMWRRAHPLWVSLVVGLATATRPVGVALLGPLVLYLWERTDRRPTARVPALSHTARENVARLRSFLRSAALWMPLACWGIGAFMLFQWIAFGDPLGWVKAHQAWSRRNAAPYLEQWMAALTLESIWCVYDPSSEAHWARHEDAPSNPLFNLPFANPIYLLLSVFLVWLGWHKRWLNGKEVLLAALLLAIPYFTHSYRHLMLSQGRFAAVAFPVYIVLGRLMARAPAPVVAACCALAGFLLAAYAALFAAWYRVT